MSAIINGLNTTSKTAVNMLKKSTTFHSANIDGAKMVNTRYFTKNPLSPQIESHQFIDGNKGVYSEFSSKTFANGNKLEIYKLPDEIIKVVKNKFGEIKAFKSSIEQHNSNPERTYEKAKDAMRAKTRNFLA